MDNPITGYNALLSLCTKVLYGKQVLYDKALSILAKLKETSNTHLELKPNTETMSLIIKACAHSKREDHEAVLGTATRIFSELAVLTSIDRKRNSHWIEDKHITYNKYLRKDEEGRRDEA